jgi:hypothetical protein
MRDRLAAETSAWKHTTHATEKTSMPSAVFEPTEGELLQTCALERTATVIDHRVLTDDPVKEVGMGWVCGTLWGEGK